jgi:hypothetical protein
MQMIPADIGEQYAGILESPETIRIGLPEKKNP